MMKVIPHGTAIFISLVTLVLLVSCFRAQLLEFGKDVYRSIRSEAHLVLFYLHNIENGNSAHLTPLILPSSQGTIYIAHRTGQVDGMPANNSLEGLNASLRKGCRFIEADFEWTSDHHLVSIHDWSTFFGAPLAQVPDLVTFVKSRRLDGYRQMTFIDVDEWLTDHPSAVLVTDVKSNNAGALVLLRAAKSYRQIIPQVYSYMEFAQAKQLGFEKIILTTYLTYYSNSSLRRFAKIDRPSAVTVPVSRLSSELIETMAEFDIPVFVHPVPLRSDLEKLPIGVKGIYSSTLCE